MAKTVTELVEAFNIEMSPEAKELLVNWTREVIDRTAMTIVVEIPGISSEQMEAIKLLSEILKEGIV